MFTEKEIDNDLKSVDKIIREYYEMPLPYKEESEEAE